MSPFAHFLHELRLKHGIRQTELAELLGYEQSYISALEVGIKGPPTPEFLGKLAQSFDMTAAEQQELAQIAEASQRKLALDTDSPQGLYWMLYELRQHVDKLHPAQIQMIRDILKLKGSLMHSEPEPLRRIKRRRREEAAM
ncbi:helix-turn-helix domain-containing protein [Ralstonia pseudosolanacearum]|uniref:helix-turn-helix domain-containing protein n=1 Tax=Ralstonia pseudosolanacearum TaxID=1310165 RepID=UPI002676EDE8|nr:helix-turn-helix transcriptional regulator [Ralstonia pseudosolanacearum]MDO3506870.1 helix-turn-helix transcriptional regulator [Ralstonia pseudosolanacearum]MDO3512920.1 helix-turn-helix transcriptional regulator [Ralstonia pseudosolanacearum]MDO3536295.1 helix-turn-helix transcriptional regulator [Ralstonia pseudosolanacearum]MDO3606770.1 helix-turn-helix transcriptional regulator [Ralstonia pseudosolanacearum]MDO3613395.1 helix-turn-helix transcriptional regulator [Ralstonia pseudosolan